MHLLSGSRGIEGTLTGSAIDNEDTLAFSVLQKIKPMTTTHFAADRTALLLVYPCNEPERVQAARDINGLRSGHSLTTGELLSLLA